LDLNAYGDWRKAAEMLALAAGRSGFVAAQLERSKHRLQQLGSGDFDRSLRRTFLRTSG